MAIIYGRQSRTRDGSTSREEQERLGREDCEHHGLDVLEVILEPASTGAYRNRGQARPEWSTVLDRIGTGKAQVVWALKTDRLSRGGGPGWAPLIMAAEAAGLDIDRFVLIHGSGFMSEFELGIRGTMDREESKKSSDRLAIAHERIAREGRFKGGRRPFGFEADGVTVRESEADEIRAAARRILAGETITSVAYDWERRQIRTGTDNIWTTPFLRQMLVAPRLVGLRVHHGEIIGPAVWEPILDRGTAERLQVKLTAAPGRRKKASRYLLTRIARCDKCGNPLNGQRQPNGTPTYSCVPQPGRPGCGRLSVNAEPVERTVVDELLDNVENPGFMARLRRLHGGPGPGLQARAERELAAAETRFAELATAFGKGQSPVAEWARISQGAQERVDAARSVLAGLAKASLPEELHAPAALRGKWDRMETGRQRAVITAAVDHVKILASLTDDHRRLLPFERVRILWRV
jgi:DNA invertase Pin-like site-specific DNA recombinase